MARLRDHLRRRSALAGAQVDLFLADAQRYSQGEEWSHPLKRLRGLECAIDAHFPRDNRDGDEPHR